MTAARPPVAALAAVAVASAAAGVVAVGGCTGDVGTIQIAVVAAPGSDLLSRIQRARVTLDEPPAVIEAERGPGGLSLSLDVSAEGSLGLVEIEGFDAAGDRIAFGRSGPLPIDAINAAITVYLAAPLGIAAAPVALDPPRTDIAVAPLSFGFAVAGGRLDDGSVSDDMAIYSVYDHAFQAGTPLPSPRAGMAATTGAQSQVYLFGGRSAGGAATGDFLRFNTLAAGGGIYTPLVGDATLARAGARAAPLGGETFAVTGSPPVLLDGLGGQALALDFPAFTGTATTLIVIDAVRGLFVGAGTGPTGAVQIAGGRILQIDPGDAGDGLQRNGHETVVLPGGAALVVGGETPAGVDAAALRFEPILSAFIPVEGFLATPRRDAATAATAAHVVVAGGTDADGVVLGDVEVFDARTLEPAAVLPLAVPRTGATAVALANGQVAILGGADADGRPIGVIELFTPAR